MASAIILVFVDTEFLAEEPTEGFIKKKGF